MTRPPKSAIDVVRLIAVGFCTCMLLTSCGQLLPGKAERRVRRQFVIEAEPLRFSIPHSERPYEYRVQVEEFSVSRFYERDQIVFRLSPEEVRFDPDNVWGVRPSDMITDAVEAYLKQAQLFTDIRQEFLDSSPDFTLTGSVAAIERFDSGDRWFVRLDVSMQLLNSQNTIVWQMDFDPVEEEVFDSDPVISVRALRELLRYNMERGIREIDRRVLLLKLQSEGRDISILLDNENGDAVADTIEGASTEEIPRSTKDYVVLPGTLITEGER
ncbi:MAG: hypothetical protein HOM68_06405 [Gemmatimonadetes bacterium]|jgi:ABC-type uncharacterized transport system auxiliary subunit|nr:hypothetical protein [Gemmatimonadota bacterium]MBT5056151.1 hypothetical protein [Gemmatimonadota bacterium]MBT5142599.1 hypothetical protein [Gemmatimonadota bacterium]MBT5592192.1 hypothetical protein [Gemmatimonadota bacterium]MBT5961104.1 hypothetical protein [Gemmatimonadota bacterium]